MKVFCLAPRENWICDRISDEWYNNCPEVSTKNISEADVIWLLASWCWNQVHPDLLASKKVVATVHHIVPEKFNSQKRSDFLLRDRFVDLYHVPNKKTCEFVKSLTKKPIAIAGYWFDQSKWPIEDRGMCRSSLGLSQDNFIVGSFQRDTEGGDLKTPKLEKGPDLFCDYVERINRKDLHVLLGGWRRQYVISRLKKSNIPFTYFELADIEKLRQMYCALDLYVISSRYEGGPQSALEAAGMKVPIVSTDVGMVSDIIHPSSIFNTLDENFYPGEDIVKFNFEQVSRFEIKSHRKNYIKMFRYLL
jgi:glycosyltransferase involved in cell wall biosynthesis